MANWSETYITLSGDRVKEAVDKIKKDTDNGYLRYPVSGRGMTIDFFTDEEKGIVISGSGRWAGPDKYFKRLCEEYGLTCLYTDAEAGCNFAYLFEYKDGVFVREKEESSYFGNLGIEIFGIEYFIGYFSWISNEENWEEEWADTVEIFKKHGVSLEDLKECWEVKSA